MSKAPMQASELGRARSSGSIISMIVPISACLFAAVVGPLLIFAFSPDRPTLQSLMETRWENRIFWPAVAVISIVLVVRNRSRLSVLTWPPHIICLLAYLAFAGASVVWAFNPQLSFIRFAQQTMILTAIVLPAMLAARTADMMRGLFLCFALGAIVNVFFVLNNSPSIVALVKGYPGYFMGKNYLGEFAAVALLLSLHEVLYPGLRRGLGIIIGVIVTVLLFMANSKTALGLAFLAPCLAGLTLIAGRLTRISPAILLVSIPIGYAIFSSISGFSMNRLSYMLYGDSTFTGRTLIWDFANYEIGRRPLLGWGYQSFWLVGADAPSIVDAPGWIKTMPNAHNGYMDTMLELGYVGLGLLLSFIIATLHAIGRMAGKNPARAWLVLSLALFVILYNFLESLWMRGFEFLWVVFVIVAAEAARYWQPFLSARAAYGSRTPVGPAPSRGALGPR